MVVAFFSAKVGSSSVVHKWLPLCIGYSPIPNPWHLPFEVAKVGIGTLLVIVLILHS